MTPVLVRLRRGPPPDQTWSAVRLQLQVEELLKVGGKEDIQKRLENILKQKYTSVFRKTQEKKYKD